MQSTRIGNLEIARVLEDDRPIFTPDGLFPDWTEDDYRAERDWLVPRFYNVDMRLLEFSVHSYVFRTPDHCILVDCGVGNDKRDRRRDYWIGAHWPYLENLRAAGFEPEDIDIVINTHLHVDHVGWNTRLADGRWEPTFPNARYLFTGTDLEYIQAKHDRRDGQYVAVYEDSVQPVLDAGLVDLVPPDHRLDENVRLEPAPGHTPGQVFVRISSDGQQGVITADAVHHPIQSRRPSWNSRACEDQALAVSTRGALFEEIADTDTMMLPAHFEPCRLRRDGGAFRFDFG